MELIADGVLILAATVAGLYCLVLSRRLHSLSQMESGVGKAITGMSAQVDEMKDALSKAKSSTELSAKTLGDQVKAAEKAAKTLEALMKTASEFEPPSDLRKSTGMDPQFLAERSLTRKLRKTHVEESASAGKKRIDGLISSYLNEFEGEDEAAIARRLVTALTSAETTGKERAL